MSQQLWTAVDTYIGGLFLPPDPVLDEALAASDAAGLPPIAVSPAMGKMLHILARLKGARSILEIGTLGGYSTIWLARALLPGGRLVTLEAEQKHAEVARQNIARAGLADVVDIRVGKALDTLPTLTSAAPFDIVFIDADKPSNSDYFRRALELTREGSLIIVDNVIRSGAVTDPASTNASVRGVRQFNEMAAAENRVIVTQIQTVGVKGHDGFALALVVAEE